MRRILPLIVGVIALAACSSGGADTVGTSGTTDGSGPVAPAPTATETTVGDPLTTETDGATDDTTSTTDTTSGPPTTTGATVALADRPFDVFVPSSYRKGTPVPLLVLLHGYGASGDIQEAYVGLQAVAEQRGFLYVHPDGTRNVLGDPYWNATDACCQRVPPEVDDVGYLTALIDDVSIRYSVDPARVWFAGHSNGGFMSHRMACDKASRIAAIVSIAGAVWLDESKCSPSEPVSVLQIHGTGDLTIEYDGGRLFARDYPSAQETVDTWVAKNGCDAMRPNDLRLDLDAVLAGNETTTRSATGCPTGIDVELWTIVDGGHIPALSPSFTTLVVDWLYAHPKP